MVECRVMANQEKAARLRAEAAKAMALAGELKGDNDLKLQLMEIAQKYEWLADRVEKAG
jgi:hypothetical protein